MYINCREFNDPDVQLKVWNTFPYLIRALDIYFVCENAATLNSLLTPNEDGSPRLRIKIDGIPYPIQYGEDGSSPLKPIVYTKPIGLAAISFADHNPHNTEPVTAIGGSDNGPLGSEWVHGTNIAIDDCVLINVEIEPEYESIAMLDGKIVVEVSQMETYDFLYTSDVNMYMESGEGPWGFGETSYGGVVEGGAEGYGGV